jgi:hypothetical protein
MICNDCLSQKKNGMCYITEDCGCNCHNTLVHPEYAHYKTAEELVRYQRKLSNDSPLFPAKVKQYPKLSHDVLTKKGLEFLKIYERKVVWDTITDPEYYIYVDLVRTWALTNPTLKRVKNYFNIYNHYLSIPRKISGLRQGFCAEVDDDYNIREEWSATKQGLIIDNPDFDENFARKNTQWGTDLLMECNRLNYIERLN